MTENTPKPTFAKAPAGKKAWYADALEIFAKLSGWVLVPLVAGYTIGKWLDSKYESEPTWFLVSTGIAFIISTIGLVTQAKTEFKKLNPKDKQK